MPKMKVHQGTKKVLKVRPGGTISIGSPGVDITLERRLQKLIVKIEQDLHLVNLITRE